MMKGLFVLAAIVFSAILITYVVVMAYFSSKILKGWKTNRDAVFDEMKQARENSPKTNKGPGENEDEPYMIAGFFHPYWYITLQRISIFSPYQHLSTNPPDHFLSKIVMLEAVVNVYYGQQSGIFRKTIQASSRSSTRATRT